MTTLAFGLVSQAQAKQYIDITTLCKKYIDIKILCKKFIDIKILCKNYIDIKILCKKYIDIKIQLTLIISNSLISNNRLSRSENLVPGLT